MEAVRQWSCKTKTIVKEAANLRSNETIMHESSKAVKQRDNEAVSQGRVLQWSKTAKQ